MNIIRFFTGFVIFIGQGGFPERFLNLCAANGITVWDAKIIRGTLTAKTSIGCYKKIRLCARRSGMRIRIKEKRGLPFILRPYKKRKGLLAGAALAAVLLTMLNAAVWTVSVSGNEKYTEAQILAIAESYGIYPGAFRKNIDIKKIRTDIRAAVPQINWFALNMDGSHITIDVAEMKGDSEIYDRTTPCNILSETDGVVIRLDAYEGHAEVSPGSAVTKGDLLISGIVEKEDGSAKFVHAKGEAIIRARKAISAKTEKCITVTETERVRIRKLPLIFGLEIPLTAMQTADAVRCEKEWLQLDGKTLPIGMKTEYNYYFAEEQLELSDVQATLLSGFFAFLDEKGIMKNAETQEKQASILVSADCVTAGINYINHEKTGLEQFFEVEEQSDGA